MATKQFVPVNFSTGQLLDEDSLDQLNNNTVALRDQSVDGKFFDGAGILVDTGIKMLGGRIFIPAQPSLDVVYGTVAFPSLFTPGCLPAVATGIMCPDQMNKFMHVHFGIGYPYADHRGFGFKINVRSPAANSNDTFTSNLWLQYVAVGY